MSSTRTIAANGIELFVREEGKGPLVVLCHGWPELSYSWRHQIPALAAAGFHVVAPDMRGYGGTSAPPEISAYSIFDNVGDMVGLVQALGESKAVIIGHDWGAGRLVCGDVSPGYVHGRGGPERAAAVPRARPSA
jgi:pimeloyl-ACP methyl ester carboxylesterase